VTLPRLPWKLLTVLIIGLLAGFLAFLVGFESALLPRDTQRLVLGLRTLPLPHEESFPEERLEGAVFSYHLFGPNPHFINSLFETPLTYDRFNPLDDFLRWLVGFESALLPRDTQRLVLGLRTLPLPHEVGMEPVAR
jgi:hypothetical protein